MKIKLRKLESNGLIKNLLTYEMPSQTVCDFLCDFYCPERAKELYNFYLENYKKRASSSNLLELLIHKEILRLKSYT